MVYILNFYYCHTGILLRGSSVSKGVKSLYNPLLSISVSSQTIHFLKTGTINVLLTMIAIVLIGQ